jgi:hypothetical protein
VLVAEKRRRRRRRSETPTLSPKPPARGSLDLITGRRGPRFAGTQGADRRRWLAWSAGRGSDRGWRAGRRCGGSSRQGSRAIIAGAPRHEPARQLVRATRWAAVAAQLAHIGRVSRRRAALRARGCGGVCLNQQLRTPSRHLDPPGTRAGSTLSEGRQAAKSVAPCAEGPSRCAERHGASRVRAGRRKRRRRRTLEAGE